MSCARLALFPLVPARIDRLRRGAEDRPRMAAGEPLDGPEAEANQAGVTRLLREGPDAERGEEGEP